MINLSEWIFPSNPKNYKVKESFGAFNGVTDWSRGRTNIEEGDIVYLYASYPKQMIFAKTRVVDLDVSEEEQFNNEEFWLDEEKKEEVEKKEQVRLQLLQYLASDKLSYSELRKNGLNGPIQSKIKLKDQLRTYLEDSVKEFNEEYEWVAFYEELAEKFLLYKDNRKEFYERVMDAFSISTLRNPFEREWITSKSLDPFSVFSAYNRSLTRENRIIISKKLKNNFSLQTPVFSSNYEGIPSSNNQKFLFMSHGDQEVTEDLWELFELVVSNELHEIEEPFIQLFDKITKYPNIKWNLTMALYWIQPRKFVPLDANTRDLIVRNSEAINSEKNYPNLFKQVISGEDYVQLVNDLNTYLKSDLSTAFDFPTFSTRAYYETRKEELTIQYSYFYDFQPYAGKKYIDPKKAADQEKKMEEFKQKGQRARKEFQKVVDTVLELNDDFQVDKVNNWINQGQIGDPHFWTFFRSESSTKSEPAIALGIFESEGKMVWSLQVDVLDYLTDDEGIRRQNQVLSVPLTDSLYYHVEDHSGNYFTPENQDSDELKRKINTREIKKVQVKYDLGIVEEKNMLFELVEEILEGRELLHPYYEATKKDKEVINQDNLYSRETFLEEVFINEQNYKRLRRSLKRKKNIILQGPPGVGKTFMATRLAYSIIGRISNRNVKMIQFHQSYSYEDFIEGYKPSVESDGFELKNGMFKDFVLDAINHPNETFFFIIDEINRGNISKIFGELLMLIEGDKRGEKYQIPLQYSGENFYVPENLYLIGMMNTADRGLALLDYALRRRFAFYDVVPAFENETFEEMVSKINSPKLTNLIDRIKSLNNQIKTDPSLGHGFEIGHSYLTFDSSNYTDDVLPEVIEYEIIPLLSEYWFDDASNVEYWRKHLMEPLNE